MDMNEFIAHFAEQFENTDASVFTPETRFRELEEWCSLIALLVISMVDDEYGVVVMFFDTVSRAHFFRKLPKTVQFLNKFSKYEKNADDSGIV